jgi:glycosyltransferase involved in cell wall biosynthesis
MPNTIWGVSRLGYLAQQDHVDVFWGGTGLLPLAGLKARTVLTIHDFVYRLFPETTSLRARWTMRVFSRASIKRADQIVSNSFGTARRLEAFYARKVAAVVPPGLTETFRRRQAGEVQAILKRYGIEQPYLLSVGTREPRKGLQSLVPAFDRLMQSRRLCSHTLVIAGDRGWKDRAITRLVESNRNIRPIGFVDDNVLSALYTGADVFVFPSIYEGFGMPVLEARACGTRVLTTNVAEIREAGGSSPTYINPGIESLGEGILRALRSGPPEVLNRANHSWTKSAAALAAVLTENGLINLGTPRDVAFSPPITPELLV